MHRDRPPPRVTSRFTLAFAGLLLPGGTIAFYRAAEGAHTPPLLLGLVVSSVIAYVFLSSLERGAVQTLQSGVVLRRAAPTRYWVQTLFLLALYLFALAFLCEV